jgi:uncharacterized protein (TIGR02646 family)
MIPIQKSSAPQALTFATKQLAKTGDAAYANLHGDVKEEIRRTLLDDQGCLCAYCMRRIKDDAKIEHLIPQHPDGGSAGARGDDLDFANMLAVCDGNAGSHLRAQTCDAHKANKVLRRVNPLEAHTLESIRYDSKGNIFSNDADVQHDLTEVLNLNCEQALLPAGREAVYAQTSKWIAKQFKRNQRSALANMKKRVASLKAGRDGKKEEYAGVAIYVIERNLRKHEGQNAH